MTSPKVLVLLAAHNGSRWIVEQLESILNQANVDVSVVISDDGSSDETRAMIEGMKRGDKLTVTSPPVPTGSAARNFLWLVSSVPTTNHEFVSFADQDDIWHEQKLSRACSALLDESASGYSCATTAFWPNGRQSLLGHTSRPTASDFFFESAGQGCTYVFTAEYYDRLRHFFLYHPQLTANLHYHDWAIYALARAWKRQWVFDHASLVRYRQHTGNDTGARTSMAGFVKRIVLIRNGWYLRQIRIITGICVSAAPDDPLIAQWNDMLARPRGLTRRLKMAKFCVEGGRRRVSDNMFLLGAVIAGWI
jgi:rhamnosyltransferase